MDPFVFAVVLFAAACHASWNALLKVGLDPFATTALIAVASAVVALPLWPIVGLPAFESWPWIVASVVLHFAYYIGLTEAYRTGDMGQVYPIARGSAPLMTAILSTLIVGEEIALAGWAGILILIAGVFLLSTHGGRDLAKIDRRAIGFAFFTAVTICGYSLVDGIGGRVSQNPHAYAVMLFLCDGVVMAIFVVLRRGTAVIAQLTPYWMSGTVGGALSLAAYWIVIWAMSVAPIGIVAALRETSVLFGALIAVVYLKEPLRAMRMAAALMIVCGIVLIRMQ
jgi:drug/metabolite transporter (DMT)-like permease